MWSLLLPAALAFDQGAWQQVLDRHVSEDGRVDYAAIKAGGALDGYLAALATAEEPLPRQDKVAFWLNAYNALTVDLVADHFPLASIRDLDGGKVWDTRTFDVAGRPLTLNQIENQILRPMGDPRVHAALNCASLGCPPLSRQAYQGSTLDAQLVSAATRWMATNGIQVDMAARKVLLSRIFDWYGADFSGMHHKDIPGLDGRTEAVIDFAIRYVSKDKADFLLRGGYSIGWIEYDWSLNGR